MQDARGAAGFVRGLGPFAAREDAWSAARMIVDQASPEPGLEVIGDFVVPPLNGPPSRDFQTLHLDFGLPLVPVVPGDVARFTALYVTADAAPSNALTRLVPIRALVARRRWADRDELVRRFAGYGHSHGAWDDAAGYVEGSLARIIEAALGQQPVLPSVKTHPEFLCGAEFTTLAAETEFFAWRGLHLESVQIEVCLRPGELFIFDNLALAHGRRGTRRPGELNQRVFGHPGLPVDEQLQLRNQVLDGFTHHPQRGGINEHVTEARRVTGRIQPRRKLAGR
jgi:hypothetical protein